MISDESKQTVLQSTNEFKARFPADNKPVTEQPVVKKPSLKERIHGFFSNLGSYLVAQIERNHEESVPAPKGFLPTPAEKELKVEGSTSPYRGCKLFEWNMISGDIKFARFEMIPTRQTKDSPEIMRKAVIRNPECFYFWAVSPKSARKKVAKMVQSMSNLKIDTDEK